MILIRVWYTLDSRYSVEMWQVNWTLPWIGPNSLVASELTGPFGLNLVWIIQVKAGPVVFVTFSHICFHLQPVLSSEHMAAFGVFGLCQIHAFVDYLRSKLNPQQFEVLFRSVISLVGFVLLTIGALLMLTGRKGF